MKKEKQGFLETMEDNGMLISVILACAITLVSFVLGLLGESAAEATAFTKQLSFYCYMWTVSFAMPYCIRANSHLRVDVFYNLYPQAGKKICDFLNDVLGLLISIGVFVASFLLLKSTIGLPEGETVSVLLQLAYLAPIVGYAAAIVHSIQRLVGGNK